MQLRHIKRHCKHKDHSLSFYHIESVRGSRLVWKMKHPKQPSWIIIKYICNGDNKEWYPCYPKKYRKMSRKEYIDFEDECRNFNMIGTW